MCGIIGVFGNKNSYSMVYDGLKVLENRGIDNFGIFTQDHNVYMSDKLEGLKPKSTVNYSPHSIGHCLHSIVSYVEQPFVSNKSAFAINCEIYNWLDLKKKYKLESDNDAKIIFDVLDSIDFDSNIIAFKNLLDEIDGVYALSYWSKNKLYLARDIIGVKPLWYSVSDGFSYASEKKALEKLGYNDVIELNPRKILIYDITENTIEFVDRGFFSTKPESKLLKIKHIDNVEKLFEKAILKRVPEKQFGLLFSGGIDSTMIALFLKKLGFIDFKCYTAVLDDPALAEPQDLIYAKKIAKKYNLDIEIIKIPLSKVKGYLKKIIPLIEDTNVIKVGVALPFYVACEQAKKDGCKVIFSGLGSEEIFAGYDRHRNSTDINSECVSGLLKMYERDLYRDDVITMSNSIELRLPFLDHNLIKYALKIPSKYKIKDGYSKMIFRDVALKNNLETNFAMRKKKAAQYGSNFHKALKKLTKSDNESYISTYLRKFYPRHNVKLGALFSSGKDSSYAVYVMQKRNYGVSCLISMKSINQDSYMFHTPNINLVELQAESMGIPLITVETEGNKEDELIDLKKALSQAKKTYGIEGVVTGALFSTYQRNRIENVCDQLGLKIFAPLWHVPQDEELKQIINLGFKVMISSIAAYGLDKKWLNKVLTLDDVDKLIALDKKIGFNVAGEGGEYESLVIDGPIFNSEIVIKDYEIISESEEVARYIVKNASLKKRKTKK